MVGELSGGVLRDARREEVGAEVRALSGDVLRAVG
jgi:hypothetical protein